MSFVVSVNTANPAPIFKKRTDVESSPSSTSLPLPDEITVKCFAYIPRCYYPSLSLVNRTFYRLIASTELNVLRSLLQQTENVLYIALRFGHEEDPIWYTLNQKPYQNESNSYDHRLVPFPSFPSLPCWGSSVIIIGQEIYVFGGCINGELTSNVFVINCILNTCRYLPSMRVPRGGAAFGVVDRKIYIIGGCNNTDSLNNWVEVFNLKKQTWECFSSLCNEELYKITLKSVVMDEKIYIMDRTNSFVYDPKKCTWERDLLLNRDWKVGSCVIDNKLYTYDFDHPNYRLIVYDPRVRIWSFVKGVDDLPKMYDKQRCRMANHGGRLAIFIDRGNNRETNIWCLEIALEMRGQQREIWGKVLWFSLVLKSKIPPSIVQCLNVTI